MSLLHPALLIGLGLAVIPILLHLLLRAKPKRLIFPALRLIQQNRRQNVRRMQLRHLWLLLLRILVIALIVLALTRPSLPAANYSLVWYEWLSLIFIVATGLGTYFGILAYWRRLPWPRNVLLTRRTMLRGGMGLAAGFLLLLGVGWPYVRRVAAEIKDPAPKVADNVPVAVVFLFDTSPGMSYRLGNQSRLQAAEQIARDQLSRFPSGSKVAVTGSHESTSPAFSLDFQAARSRIDAQEIRVAGLPLNHQLRAALQAQEDDRRRVTQEQTSVPEEKRNDRFLREIYLFTDLTRTSWREDASMLLHQELERLKSVALYLIDVGEPAPTNAGIKSVKLTRDTVPVGSSQKVNVVLSTVGNIKPEQTVEFYLAGEDGVLVKRGQQVVTVENGTDRNLTFDTPPLAGRFQQGEIRISGSDPLAIDDVGYFTVRTLPKLKVAIVAETKVAAYYWQTAIEYISSEKITDFQAEFLTTGQLRDADIKSFDVIFLINAASPEEAIWMRLHDYVEAGGGLGIFLGASNSAGVSRPRRDLIDSNLYDNKSALSVLPAKLIASLPFTPAQTMDLRNSQHTLLKRLDDLGVLSEIGAIDIYRFWKVEPVDGAVVVAKFGGSQGFPALVERRLGRGRVMLMTTAVDKVENAEWNDFVGTPWYLVFADQLTQYLSQQASVRSNLDVGDEVILPVDRDRKLRKIVVRMPDFKQRLQEIPADSKNVTLRDLTSVGSYRVDAAEGEAEYRTGFSLNLPAPESDLRRLETRDLDALFGEGRYTVNRDPSSLERSVHSGRMGQEMYSFVVAMLVVIFALEQFTAAWFYRTDE